MTLILRCQMTANERSSTYKVHTDSGDVAFRVGIIGESKKQARLSNTGVSNKQELEEVVVSISMVSYPGDGIADRRAPPLR